MKVIRWLCAIGLFAVAGAASARCTDGATGICYVSGVQGTRMCNDGEWTECEIPPPPPKVYDVRTKYKVLTVVYAPPGTANGYSTSSVSYSSGSGSGSTTSSEKAFNQSYAVSASATFGTNNGASGSFSYSRNSSNTRAINLNKTYGTTIASYGPQADGIDHDRDQIWLWLNPRMRLSLTEEAGVWSILPQTMELQYVYVGHLKNPALLPAGTKARLDAAGITTADYAEILKANPYAYGAAGAVNTARYAKLNTTFPYQPPYAPGDPVPTFGYSATYTRAASSTSSVTNAYAVGLSVESGFDLGFLQAKLQNQNQWTWTDTDTRSTTTSTSESAQVTVGGPSYGYTGPTLMSVYYDTLYKSFLFVPVTGPVQLQGTIKSNGDEPVAGREIVLTAADGVEHRTYSNAQGEYRFVDVADGPATISAGGEQRKLQRATSARNVDLLIP